MNKRQLQRLGKPGETWAQTLARVHHEAYMVEAFGYEASGLAPAEFLRLVEYGVIHEPDPKQAPNAFEMVFEGSGAFGNADNKTRSEMRSWSAEKWRTYLAKQVVTKIAADGDRKTITGTLVPRDVVVLPQGSIPSEHMHEAENVAHLVQESLSPPPPGHVSPTRRAPQTIGKAKTYAYRQAMERAGIFCKRLGEVTGGDFTAPSTERWHFDKILDEVDPVLRAKRLKEIRRHTLQALQDDWTPQQLAHALQTTTRDFARDWMRVARTELQNAWNEGVGLDAVQKYGVHARVARIPETTACHMCRELFLGDDGEPIVFDLHILIHNGNNMNVPKGMWKPVLSAVHPNCLCSVVAAPPGHKVTRGGDVVPE